MHTPRASAALIQSRRRWFFFRADEVLLLALLMSSWLMYPLMVSLVFPVGTRVLFLGILTILTMIYFISDARLRIPSLGSLQIVIVTLWVAYLFFLLVATIRSGSSESVAQFMKLGAKYAFLIFFLVFLRPRLIAASLVAYANLMVLLVIMAVLVMVGVAYGTLQPVMDVEQIQATGVTRVLHVYWGAFYGVYPVSAPFPLYRLHSFCEEPGTFALALLPALYWFVIVERAWVRALVICLGIVLSGSLGGFLAFGLSLPVLWKFRSNGRKLLVFVLIVIAGFVVISLLARNPQLHGMSYIAEKVQGQGSSLGERATQTTAVLDYIADNPAGTGAGVGLPSEETIANGYAFAVLQSGALGGLCYIVAFLLLAVLAITRFSRHACAGSVADQQMAAVIALSVLTCLFFGLQRMQPDLSIWHMWLYACLFYVASDRRHPVSRETA